MQDGTPPKTWTDERVEELKALWAEGLSAQRIADRLGGMTRNTVMGKLDRLGLLGNRTAQEAGAASPEAAPPAAKPTQRQPRPIPAPPDTLEIQARLVGAGQETPVPAVAEPKPRDPGKGSLVGIQSLNTGTCRWPVGDPQREGFGYCGGKALTGRPYCDAHAKLAYEPPRERRRAS